ncbi:MAG: hypothetical protein AB1861_05260 [Cyanobacteriota bacterium]
MTRVVALLDKVVEVKSVLRELVEPTRQEDVCISYRHSPLSISRTDSV